MLHILATTLPIFAIMAVGFGAVRSGLISDRQLQGIGLFVLYFAVPTLIFRTLTKSAGADIVNLPFLAAYGGGALACFGLVFVYFRLAARKSVVESGLLGFGSAMPNSIYVGYPMLGQIFEIPPAAAFAMALLVENLIIFPLALIVLDIGRTAGETGRSARVGGIVRRLATNPILLAIMAGAAMSLAGFDLVPPVDRVAELLAGSAPAAGLFFVGGLIATARFGGNWDAAVLTGLAKLILQPLLVVAAIWLLPDFDPTLQIAAIVLAASPMIAIFPIIGAMYGHGPHCASILLVTTSASFVTISAWLWVLEL